ncbi:alpha-amylase family glycosyl hydrolase [Glaciecola sp. 1036]|uniref:alpha-amylase family glycosyl hydrolase n=1 Tax=Alteromonadaceae TaxID=72275 RepID=UPI003D04F1A4
MLNIEPLVKVQTPDWSKNATIYQINTRQFSPQGDFKGVIEQLPRIKALGSDIIWLMPIHPIGELNRKGELGSPYAVKDYFDINPEFGNKEDFKTLVKVAHELKLKVILDWVPNHSAWDNPLTKSHPEWYLKDYKGDFRPSPWWDWEDIIEFDYDQIPLREYMIEALCYWVTEFDIDGYRCDVAGYVPKDFWKQARQALDQIKPVFMLAEWENRDLHEYGFDMTYAWSWNETMHGIAMGDLPLDKLRKYYSWNERSWPKQAFRMTFVSNHDENAWEGTPDEKFGPALPAAVTLSVLGEGMPLIHNGQEAGETKRLAFFERDPIDWQHNFMADFYSLLLRLRKQHSALWNGKWGATMIQVPNTAMDKVFSFVRQDQQSKWFFIFNFSKQEANVTFCETLFCGQYNAQINGQLHDYDEKTINIPQDFAFSLPPWGYQVFIQHI